ncbi:uracil-DNA glycosylase family protein [Magnetospirillum sp. 64-120]|uniref:uracil-DNA glycosylase n=1 Tax=Magnetospirillum sp. 64-120 TaxID=1895778 RepID=UPI000929464C|nr:uracil-DNA glycosylase family protein [Magnetospirillum sp. 64-120]OJX68423.1 MAG: uracil-DNA glycosylase [Magnetospirillum sp. 64-120]
MPLDIAPIDLLRWYLDAGVDEAVGEMPVDRFAASAKPAAPVLVAPPAPDRPTVVAEARPIVAVPAQDGVTAAHLAAGCQDLAQLRQAMEGFDGLSLKRTAISTVFADGNPEAGVMCIGEAPGQEEDRQGLPFVGRSGKLLDRMLGSIGLDRDSAYITNVVPWRPVDNRKPTAEEVATCLPFVIRHVELVDPKLLILFGGAAASALLARHEGINRLRGRWFDFSSPGLPRPVPAMATFHPAYLLRTPAAKREAWRDLLAIRARLDMHS